MNNIIKHERIKASENSGAFLFSPPIWPLLVIQNEWCVVFCPLCHSSFPKKHIFFGKRYCINKDCSNSFNKKNDDEEDAEAR